MHDANDFVFWLEAEARERFGRNWQQKDLVDASNGLLKKSQIARILSRENQPGPQSAKGIAKALKKPEEVVFRKAGLLPPLPEAAGDEDLEELIDAYKRLDGDRRDLALDYVEMLLRRSAEAPREEGFGEPREVPVR